MAPDRTTDQLNHDEVVTACMACLVCFEQEGQPSPAKAYRTVYFAAEGTIAEKHRDAFKTVTLETLNFFWSTVNHRGLHSDRHVVALPAGLIGITHCPPTSLTSAFTRWPTTSLPGQKHRDSMCSFPPFLSAL